MNIDILSNQILLKSIHCLFQFVEIEDIIYRKAKWKIIKLSSMEKAFMTKQNNIKQYEEIRK